MSTSKTANKQICETPNRRNFEDCFLVPNNEQNLDFFYLNVLRLYGSLCSHNSRIIKILVIRYVIWHKKTFSSSIGRFKISKIHFLKLSFSKIKHIHKYLNLATFKNMSLQFLNLVSFWSAMQFHSKVLCSGKSNRIHTVQQFIFFRAIHFKKLRKILFLEITPGLHRRRNLQKLFLKQVQFWLLRSHTYQVWKQHILRKELKGSRSSYRDAHQVRTIFFEGLFVTLSRLI